VPIEVPKSLQKKAKPVKDMDTIIAQAKAMSEKYAGQYDCVTDKDVLIDYVDTIISEKRTGLDTETTGLNIFKDPVVGFSLYAPGRKAIYVPMLHLSRFTGKVDPNQLPVEFCAQQLNRLNGVPGMTIDYFNAPFDMNELWYSMGVKLWDICSNDASLMMRLLNTERHRNNNLKDLHAEFCSHTTRGPRFGELFPPGTFNRCPFKYTSAYGARDAEMASELVDYAYSELRKPENAGLLRVWETIERPLIPVLLRMREKGVLVDEAKRAELIVKYRGLKEAAEADVVHEYEPYIPKINQWRMRFGRTKGRIIDMPVKIGSDGQLKILLYDIMGLPKPESGKVDKHALCPSETHSPLINLGNIRFILMDYVCFCSFLQSAIFHD
jgi:DNA polymerase-1